MEKVKKFLPLVLGVILIGVGAFFYFRNSELARVCTEPSTATVVNMREDFVSTDGEGIRYVYYPVVQYTAGDQTITEELGTSSNPPAYNINDTIEILYNPDKLNEFMVAGENSYIITIIMGALGAVFLVAGIYVLVKK